MAAESKPENPRARKPLTQERLKEILHYDLRTGIFTWIVATARRISIGDAAGCVNTSDHYIYIRIDGKLYAAHRLAFLYVEGAFPPEEVDHINQVRSENHFGNLRHATRRQNSHNRSVGANIAVHKQGVKRFQARIKANGKSRSLGYYLTREEAECAYWSEIDRMRDDYTRPRQ